MANVIFLSLAFFSFLGLAFLAGYTVGENANRKFNERIEQLWESLKSDR